MNVLIFVMYMLAAIWAIFGIMLLMFSIAVAGGKGNIFSTSIMLFLGLISIVPLLTIYYR